MPWDTCSQVALFKTISPEISFPILLLELFPSSFRLGFLQSWLPFYPDCPCRERELLLLIARWTLRFNCSYFLCELTFDASDCDFLTRCGFGCCNNSCRF